MVLPIHVLCSCLLIIPGQLSPPDGPRMSSDEALGDMVLGTSPRRRVTVTTAGQEFVSVQLNVDSDGNNVVGDAANQPSITASPLDNNQVVVVWRVFKDVDGHFREAGVAYSHDGGQAWSVDGLLDPGIWRTDPVVAAAPDGSFYYQGLGEPMVLFKSADGGVTWTRGAATEGWDSQWIVIDQTSGPGHGQIYSTWSEFGAARTGTGVCYQAPPLEMRYGTMTHPAVSPDGTLVVLASSADYVVWRSTNAEQLYEAMSFEKLATLDIQVDSDGGWINPRLGRPWIVSDHSTGPNRGNLYALVSMRQASRIASDVVFTRSEDGGMTWSAPVMPYGGVNDHSWRWFGTIDVAPNGRIDVVWYHSPDALETVTTDVHFTSSHDGGRTWSDVRTIAPSFEAGVGRPHQGDGLGDYVDLYANESYTMLAYAATYNDEQDVYFLKIAHDCNGNRVLDDLETANGATDCNGNRVPDECERGGLEDCNRNDEVDLCEIAANGQRDCDHDGVPDECQEGLDCDRDGLLDVCALRSGMALDCNDNNVPDACDIASGSSDDQDWTGVPDECELRVPMEFKTIQAAVDAAGAGHTILLADGVHAGAGNQEVVLGTLPLTIACEHGPDNCVVDLGGTARAFNITANCAAIAIRDMTIANGLGDDGGALFCAGSEGLIVDHVIFRGNTARVKGGAIYHSARELGIDACEFDGNQAPNGGGLYVDRTFAAVTKSRFVNGTANSGGGAELFQARTVFEGCEWAGNHATAGGGLFVSDGAVTVTNSTVFRNSSTALSGGFVGVGADGLVTNTILWGNMIGEEHDESAQVAFLGSSKLSVQFSLIEGLDMLTDIGNFESDPQFVDPIGPDGTPGTADDDLQLAAGSPAIDSGQNSALSTGVSTDIRGRPRFVDDPDTADCPQAGAECGRAPIVDVGANEYQPEPVITIISSEPAGGAIDARQPSSIDGNEPDGWTTMTVTFSDDASGVTARDFAVQYSQGSGPAIDEVVAVGLEVVVQLTDSIPVGNCTTLVYTPSGSAVTIGYLPGDVDGDGTSGPLDLLALIDHLNGVVTLREYQCDINRTGKCEPNDILRVVDLLNGAGAYRKWANESLVGCP